MRSSIFAIFAQDGAVNDMAKRDDEKPQDLITILRQYLAVRSQPDREANPSTQQKTSEREGRSEFSGGRMGGGTWGGRER